MSLLGRRLGWGYGIILGEVEGNVQVILELRWQMALRLDFGMIYGVGTRH